MDMETFSNAWNYLPQGARWGLIGGGLGAASGLFSDTPVRSALKRGLLGGLIGAGASAAGPGIASLFRDRTVNPDPVYLPGGGTTREEAALNRLDTPEVQGPVQPGQPSLTDQGRIDAVYNEVARPPLPATGHEIRGGLGPISVDRMWDAYQSAATPATHPWAPSIHPSLQPNPTSRMEAPPYQPNYR